MESHDQYGPGWPKMPAIYIVKIMRGCLKYQDLFFSLEKVAIAFHHRPIHDCLLQLYHINYSMSAVIQCISFDARFHFSNKIMIRSYIGGYFSKFIFLSEIVAGSFPI